MDQKRILVVEDEVIIAMEITDRLESMGYNVIKTVPNGKMAIDAAINEKPDLILMDIMLQGELDGIETATKILESSDLPVIYLTANADESTLERAKVSDAFGYLIKPFEEKELNTTIEMAQYKHQMEIKLKESEERFKSLVENSSVGIFRLSKNGEILHGNPTFLKLLGFESLVEIVGKSFENFIVDGELNFRRVIELVHANGKINRSKIEILNSDGEKISVSLGGNAVWHLGELNYFDGTIEDISKQVNYEKHLIAAKENAEESDKLKTEFLAGMSHEIRTPINTIMNYISLLKDELKAKTDLNFEEFFDSIQVGSLRLTRTIDSILNMAQFKAGTFDTFKTKIDIVEEILNNLFQEFKYSAEKGGLELKFSNRAEDTSLLGDKYSLSQLFANLVDNALKYTHEGYVEIRVYNDKNGALSVDVEDTGIGISEDFLPTLFNPFTQEEQGYTRKFEGNGLGLALVKQYCKLNDGIIEVDSKKGEGTKFTVCFTNTNKNNKYTKPKRSLSEHQ